MICKNCGTRHDGHTSLLGNGWVELVLWLLWLIPGLIYSVWRRTQRRPACAICGSVDLVSLGSPVGRRLSAESPHGDAPPRAPAGPQARKSRVVGPMVVGLAICAAMGALLIAVAP